MTKPEQTDAQRRETLQDEARRLASSGKHATWQEVRDALLADGPAPEDVRSAFAETSFRDEVAAIAEAAHGVGGPATE